MKLSNKSLVILGSTVVILLTLGLMYSMFRNAQAKDEMAEMVEVMNYEKEQLEDEFSDFATQFDGYATNINNDSLFTLLDQEKTKVTQLLDELRTTKATNARRITELKKELSTVRSVMKHYVFQIDSLDKMNKSLVAENREVRRRYQTVAQEAEQLEEEKEILTKVVSRASMMEVSSFNFIKLNKRDRKTSLYSQIAKLQFQFTVSKNITVQPGMKTVYLRIIRPDGEVMQKSTMNVFAYENKEIPYSVSKAFEYEGEEVHDVLYWSVEEILQKGTYSAEFFIDGNIIGVYDFIIK